VTERTKGRVALTVLAVFVALVLALVPHVDREGVVTAKTYEPPHRSTLFYGGKAYPSTYPAAWTLTVRRDGVDEYVLVPEDVFRAVRVGDPYPLTSP